MITPVRVRRNRDLTSGGRHGIMKKTGAGLAWGGNDVIFELPLALALSCLLAELPAIYDALRALPMRLHRLLEGRIARRRPQTASALAAWATLACMALAGALGALHPALRVALLALAIPARAVAQRTMDVRARLDAGDVPAAAALAGGEGNMTYEQVVRAACDALGRTFCSAVFAPALLALLLTPLRLGAAAAWAFMAAAGLASGSRRMAQAVDACLRPARWLLAALCALCTALCGLEMDAALAALRTPARDRLVCVVRAAVGIGDEPTHAPLAGDLVQATLLLSLALSIAVILETLLLLPLMR